MPNFWRVVNNVLEKSELVIEVLDARMVEESRNTEIEQKIHRRGKKLLYVINKSDLVDLETLKKLKSELQPSVFISSLQKLGTTILKKKILEISHGKMILVGIVGYPNVGKSSLINALAGRKAALTSAESGFTKGVQKIRIHPKIILLDTPGVFPKGEKDIQKHNLLGAVDYGKIRNPELAALELVTEKKELIQRYYKLKADDPEEILEELAKHFRLLLPGGKLNIEAAARRVLRNWQKGEMK
ncbi:50S ribosome-binding GTPase [Candidatus Woesearchaeota archaeon]|nr:50S ribosome-binding GTPase [Candidatus Woesearchaeota archaeon]